MSTRIFSVLVGLWLVVSVFMWPHTAEQTANGVLSGIACMTLALVGLYFDPARYVAAALGVWIFLSSFLFPSLRRATVWNNALVGIATFVSALLAGVPAEEGLSPPRPWREARR
jgi:hypothetical protein